MKRWVIADPVRFVTLCMATAPALSAIPALVRIGVAWGAALDKAARGRAASI